MAAGDLVPSDPNIGSWPPGVDESTLDIRIRDTKSQLGRVGPEDVGGFRNPVFGGQGSGAPEFTNPVFAGAAAAGPGLPTFEIPPERTATQKYGRVGLTTGTQILGEIAGSRGGVPGGMIGGGVGAAAGSLLAEQFDPSPDPAHEAMITGGFGLIPLGPLGRWLFSAKTVTKEGEALMDLAERKGLAIPPALASNSRGMQLAQNIGRATLGGEKVDNAVMVLGRALGVEGEEMALREMGLTKVEIDAYQSLKATDPAQAMRLVEGAAGYALQGKIALESVFKAADNAALRMKSQGLKSHVAAIEATYARTGRELPEGIKGTFDAIQGMADTVSLRELHTLRSDLLRAGRFEGTKDVDAAQRMARELSDVVTKGGHRAANMGGLGDAWLGASNLWRQHKQGELVKDIVQTGMKEVGADSVRAAPQRIINELQKDWVVKALEPEQLASLRQYANVLQRFQESSGSAIYQFATRGAQVATAATLTSLALRGSAAAGGAATLGPAIAVATPIFAVPEVMAHIFASPRLSQVFLRGMQMETPLAAINALGALIDQLAKEGLVQRETAEEFRERAAEAAKEHEFGLAEKAGRAIRGRISR